MNGCVIAIASLLHAPGYASDVQGKASAMLKVDDITMMVEFKPDGTTGEKLKTRVYTRDGKSFAVPMTMREIASLPCETMPPRREPGPGR